MTSDAIISLTDAIASVQTGLDPGLQCVDVVYVCVWVGANQ